MDCAMLLMHGCDRVSSPTLVSDTTPDTDSQPVLEVSDLRVEFDTYGGIVQAVRGVNFAVHPGKTLAIVGESGCGKSVTVQSLMGLIPMPPGRITGGSARYRGQEILGRTRLNGRE